jgi:decaprenylphospho-beta-D-ribofuranose 2-oxidase
MDAPERRRITAYGLDRSVESWVLRPESTDDVLACLGFARQRQLSICPAGGRNSFGDVFLLGDHLSLDMTRLNRTLAFDPRAGTISVQAGALDRDVLLQVMPAGWQLPAVSGSLWNTIGGNLSSNINGKDAWKVGTFGDQVRSFTIVLANGETRTVDRQSDRELFDAVVGGLGLFGVVTEVTLQLTPIPSVMLDRTSRPVAGLDALLAQFAALDPSRVDFSYAWLDAYPRGAALGRSVSETARFVPTATPVAAETFAQGFVPRARIFGLPPPLFWGAVRSGWRGLFQLGLDGTTFRTLNALMYARARRAGDRRDLVSFPDYQYPMVKWFPYWNLKFAPWGFNEVQVLFPTAQFAAGMRALLDRCRRHGRTPEVCAVRRHRADGYPLSFAGDGLSATFPFSLAGFTPGALEAFRGALMATILAHGGKVYLAKFPYLSREHFRAMYPAVDRFLAVKARVDPSRVFWSETAARLLG